MGVSTIRSSRIVVERVLLLTIFIKFAYYIYKIAQVYSHMLQTTSTVQGSIQAGPE